MGMLLWCANPHQQSSCHSALRVGYHLSNFPCPPLLAQGLSHKTVSCLPWVKLMPHYVSSMWNIATNPWKQTRRGCCRTSSCIRGQGKPSWISCSDLLFMLQLILQCNNQRGWSVDKRKANKREGKGIWFQHYWTAEVNQNGRQQEEREKGTVLMLHPWRQDVTVARKRGNSGRFTQRITAHIR